MPGKTMIPKKKYRDKVRQRLALVNSLLLDDPKRLEEMMKRVGGFSEKGELHNRIEAIRILLQTDVPTLLNALDTLNQKNEETNTIRTV